MGKPDLDSVDLVSFRDPRRGGDRDRLMGQAPLLRECVVVILPAATLVAFWACADWAYVRHPTVYARVQGVEFPVLLGLLVALVAGHWWFARRQVVVAAVRVVATLLLTLGIVCTFGMSFHCWIGGRL